MRYLFLACSLLYFYTPSSAQAYKTTYTIVPILANPGLYLNSGARGEMGGRSREILTLNLPPNTVEWYYVFSSTPKQGQTQPLNLANQLTAFVDSQSGPAPDIMTRISPPAGSGVCDVYLLPDQGAVENFRTKQLSFNFNASCSKLSNNQGVVQVRPAYEGTYIIGLKNPSVFNGVNVSIEVAAVVATREPIAKTDAQQKAGLYSTLGRKLLQEGDYDKSIDYSKRALALDSSLFTPVSTIALANLMTGKPDALDNYIHVIELMKASEFPQRAFADALHDLDEVKRKAGDVNNLGAVQGLLQSEYKKLDRSTQSPNASPR